METVSLLLSAAALFALSAALSLSIIVRSLMGYGRQSTGLQARLRELGSDLERLRGDVPALKARVDVLLQQVLPQKDLEAKMRGYYGRLQGMRSEQERKEQEERGEGPDEIQIHRPGIAGL